MAKENGYFAVNLSISCMLKNVHILFSNTDFANVFIFFTLLQNSHVLYNKNSFELMNSRYYLTIYLDETMNSSYQFHQISRHFLRSLNVWFEIIPTK